VLRLSPIVPLSLMSYILGISKIDFLPYLSGTILGLIPGTVAYCYMGYKLKEAYEDGVDFGRAVTIIATIIMVYVISVKANNILKEL